MSHVLRFTVPNLNQKELIPPVKNTSSPVWSIVWEFPIYKSEIEQVPEIVVDSIDSINSKILQTFNLNIWDLALSNKDISEVPLKSYALTPQKQLYLWLKFLKNGVVDPDVSAVKKPMTSPTKNDWKQEILEQDLKGIDDDK